MQTADSALDADIDQLETDLGTTNTNLDLEVAEGVRRDGELTAHEGRITTLEADTLINKDALAELEVQMNKNLTTVTNDLVTKSDGTSDAINALEGTRFNIMSSWRDNGSERARAYVVSLKRLYHTLFITFPLSLRPFGPIFSPRGYWIHII